MLVPPGKVPEQRGAEDLSLSIVSKCSNPSALPTTFHSYRVLYKYPMYFDNDLYLTWHR